MPIQKRRNFSDFPVMAGKIATILRLYSKPRVLLRTMQASEKNFGCRLNSEIKPAFSLLQFWAYSS